MTWNSWIASRGVPYLGTASTADEIVHVAGPVEQEVVVARVLAVHLDRVGAERIGGGLVNDPRQHRHELNPVAVEHRQVAHLAAADIATDLLGRGVDERRLCRDGDELFAATDLHLHVDDDRLPDLQHQSLALEAAEACQLRRQVISARRHVEDEVAAVRPRSGRSEHAGVDVPDGDVDAGDSRRLRILDSTTDFGCALGRGDRRHGERDENCHGKDEAREHASPPGMGSAPSEDRVTTIVAACNSHFRVLVWFAHHAHDRRTPQYDAALRLAPLAQGGAPNVGGIDDSRALRAGPDRGRGLCRTRNRCCLRRPEPLRPLGSCRAAHATRRFDRAARSGVEPRWQVDRVFDARRHLESASRRRRGDRVDTGTGMALRAGVEP